MTTKAALVALFFLAGVASPAFADDAGKVAKQRRQEVDVLTKETFYVTLLAREDVRTAGPAPKKGRATELRDGSYYLHEDPGIAFEELASVRIVELFLRKKGKTLVATLAPPSTFVAPEMRNVGPEFAVTVLVDLDIEEGATVRDTLRKVVYLPGETPPDEAIARCLARYPTQDGEHAQMRCPREAR